MNLSLIANNHPICATMCRISLAVAGGLLLANAGGLMLAVWLPLPKADATALAVFFSYAMFVAAALWVFAASSMPRALVYLILPMAFCTGLFILKQGTAAI